MHRADLSVIGAGPYAYAAAAFARYNGVDVRVVVRPMAFWRDQKTSLTGLYMTGFASTRDFGAFFGFTKGCPASARIAVAEMLR